MNHEDSLTDTTLNQLRKELRLTRIFCGISSLLTVCMLVVGIYVFSSLQPLYQFINEAQPVLSQLSQLDVDSLNTALQGLDTEELSTALNNLNSAAEALSELSQGFGSLFGGN